MLNNSIIFYFSQKKTGSNLIIFIIYLFSSLQHQLSNSKKVHLKGVTLKSTGIYRCEISAEEPDFKTVQGEGQLVVVCKFSKQFFKLKSWTLKLRNFWRQKFQNTWNRYEKSLSVCNLTKFYEVLLCWRVKFSFHKTSCVVGKSVEKNSSFFTYQTHDCFINLTTTLSKTINYSLCMVGGNKI